jgi:SAM-dependent methyltransferase
MSPIKNTRKSRADSDALGRFYTSPAVASLLVKKMDLAGVQTLVDLGCGSGNLAHAALGQWPGCSVLTVDLDEKVPVVIDERLAGSDFRHVQADVLGVGLVEELGVVRDSFDAAVCNPPFVRPVWCEAYGQLLAAAGFPAESVPASQVQADILFLAQNLMLLREGGVLGFIAPASFVSGKPYRALRAAILAQHRVRAVVRLPRNAFAQADARAFIVILEKGRPTETLVSVTNLSPAGVESAAHWIEPRQAALRLDGGPEEGLETSLGDVSDATENAGTQELADVALSVVRGSFTRTASALSHDRFSGCWAIAPVQCACAPGRGQPGFRYYRCRKGRHPDCARGEKSSPEDMSGGERQGGHDRQRVSYQGSQWRERARFCGADLCGRAGVDSPGLLWSRSSTYHQGRPVAVSAALTGGTLAWQTAKENPCGVRRRG